MQRLLTFGLVFFMVYVSYSQAPLAFNIDSAQSVVFGVDDQNPGNKFMWLGDKKAIRAGTFVLNASFDYGFIGETSAAFGLNNRASGTSSAAIGCFNTATGLSAIALGHYNISSGDYATSHGYYTIASGAKSYAHGEQVTASGENSTAIGKEVSTNLQKGAMILGDSDPHNFGYTYVGQPDQFVARFANGYLFKTSNGNQPATGVQVLPGGNAWTSISDVNRKENFAAMDDILSIEKLASVDYTSWNYKGQDPAIDRHYGIMAQDFYALFGRDEYGVIGRDTLVNPIDMIGVMMSALKGAKILINEANHKIDDLQTRLTSMETEQDKTMHLLNEMNALIAKDVGLDN